jgi:hypothetical protein
MLRAYYVSHITVKYLLLLYMHPLDLWGDNLLYCIEYVLGPHFLGGESISLLLALLLSKDIVNGY